MEERYFTPDIEDLHIGYECEICTNHGYESFNEHKEIWESTIISFKDEKNGYSNELNDLIIGMDDGYQPIRVKFLDQIQIEKEGWKLYKHYEERGVVGFEKDNYLMSWDYLNKRVGIIVKDPSLVKDYFYSSTFRGECKDINTFRKICKLLNL